MPFWILIGAHFWLGERMTPKKLIGLLLAFLGVVLVFSDKLSLPGPEAIVGDLLSIGAGLLWAATTLVIKATRLVRTSAEKLLLYQLAVSSVMMAPLLPLAGPILREPTPLSGGALAFQALCRRVHLYSVVLADAPLPGGGLVELYLLDPRLSVMCGGLLLGEPLSWKIFAALGLIAGGLVLVNGRRVRAAGSGAMMRDILP